jgi:hypothetical protein
VGLRWGGLSMRRSVHEVHEAARASRGRSGAPKVRVCTRHACGFWPAGRQLAWLRGGLQWRAEVDFPAEVSMLWGHVASCRLTRSRWSRIVRSSPDLRHRLCLTRGLQILDLLCRRGVLKKRGSTGPVVMGGPVWGGRQAAAGKADSQAFCGKRLPHRWGVS